MNADSCNLPIVVPFHGYGSSVGVKHGAGTFAATVPAVQNKARAWLR